MRNLLPSVISILLICGVASSSVLAEPQPCSGGVVALTFDDGPTPHTTGILDALKLHGMKATFFLVGLNVKTYPEIAKRIVAEGHDVGNHTWDHPALTVMSDVELDQQFRSTNDIIKQVTGVRPRFARSPYGMTNARVQGAMSRNGLQEVLWSQDSWDWTEASSDAILHQLTIVPPGGTLLMHDWAPHTLATIPRIYWYLNTFWKDSPICAGRLEPTTIVQPTLGTMRLFFFAHAVPWERSLSDQHFGPQQ